jgi:hypothetical protein
MVKSMNWKGTAQRLALYVKECGVEPVQVTATDYKDVALALQQQYQRLHEEQPERVTEARAAARQRIRTVGLMEAAAGLVSVVPSPPWVYRRYKKSKAQLKRWFGQHSDQAVPCPHCRMNCGLRKRAWLTKELAQAARLRAGSGARVYECPEHEGYWHVGHRRKAKKRTVVTDTPSNPSLTPKEG